MKRFLCWFFGGLLFIVLVISLIVNLVFISKDVTHFKKQGEDVEDVLVDGHPQQKGKVALIKLDGLISYQMPGQITSNMIDDFVFLLRRAVKDPEVGSILIRVNSPGGEVTASDVLYHEIVKTNEKKPVMVYFDSLAASGAFYAAMGSSNIMTNELAITGSIGVIIQAYNVQGLGEWAKIKLITFKSGKMKDMLNPMREVTEEEKAYVQGLVNETYEKFLHIVANSRHLDADKLRATVADGRIISGKKALEEKLVDEVGYLEDAYAKARVLGKLAPDAPVVETEASFSLGLILNRLAKSPLGSMQVNIGSVPSAKLESGKMYFVTPSLFSSF